LTCGSDSGSLEEVIRIADEKEDQSLQLQKLALVLEAIRLVVELLR